MGFIVVHVALVVLTGFARNMKHIVRGTDDLQPTGIVLGLIDIALVVLSKARYAPELQRCLRLHLKPTNDCWRVDS